MKVGIHLNLLLEKVRALAFKKVTQGPGQIYLKSCNHGKMDSFLVVIPFSVLIANKLDWLYCT